MPTVKFAAQDARWAVERLKAKLQKQLLLPRMSIPSQTPDHYAEISIHRNMAIPMRGGVRLYASSSAVDTDFTATMVDVFPRGAGHRRPYAHLIQEGVIRASYRESDRNPSSIEPEHVHEYRIDLWATSYVVKAGHRIRVEISSSNFNRFDRNPNTGQPFGTAVEPITANQQIFDTAEYPSRITLPIYHRQNQLARHPDKLDRRQAQ
jgi:putative CocE/NonD family hydrolase